MQHIAFKDILCYTVPDLPPIQPFVFLTAGENNTKEACTSSLNLESWQLISDPNNPATEVPTIPPESTTPFEEPVMDDD